MIEARWHDYVDVESLSMAVAREISLIVEDALSARGQALLALPGGGTPLPIYTKLAQADIDWRHVTIIPTDDRLVARDNRLCNAAMLAGFFTPKGATVQHLVSDIHEHQRAGQEAGTKLQQLHWPPDLVWLGVGSDGHSASIFAGPDLEAALNAPETQRAIGVMPDPLPPEAPVARVTLTRAAILSARTLNIVVTGGQKRHLLEQAIADSALSTLPIGRILSASDRTINIHWCP